MKMKIYTNKLGHMTKMAAMPIYGKKPLKIISSRTLGTWYVALGIQVFQSYSNDDLGLTLTFFMARSNMGKCKYIGFHGKF